MPGSESNLLAANVASWHNRHPLARRITAAQVTGLGVVALPFASLAPVADASSPVTVNDTDATPPAASSTLRQRAQSAEEAAAPIAASHAAAPAASERAFDEAFLPTVSPRRAAAFAAQHGADTDPSAGAGPRRDVVVQSRLLGGRALRWRFVRTAAVEAGDWRTRVLISADAQGVPRILGRRLYSPTRIGAGLGLLLLAIALPVAVHVFPSAQTLAAAPPLEAASVPTSGTPSITTQRAPSNDRPEDPQASAEQSAVATAPAVPASSLPAAQPAASGADPAAEGHARAPLVPAAPASDPPRAATTTLSHPQAAASANAEQAVVQIRPRLDPDVARRARLESAAARAASAPQTAAASLPKETRLPAAAAVPRQRDDGTYALVARPTRTRAASQVMLGLMQATVAEGGVGGTRAEVLPVQEGYRASWWPFSRRSDAEGARERLARLGVPVEIVEF